MPANDDILSALFVTQNQEKIDQFQGTAVIECLSRTSGDQVLKLLLENQDDLVSVKTSNIPQFSNINDVFKVIQILIDSPEEKITRNTIGYYLCEVGAKDSARTKYGENHLKIAVQLGLIDDAANMQVTDLGLSLYLIEDQAQRMEILSLLSLRVPVIQYALLQAVNGRFNIFNYLLSFLARSTAVRRRSSIRVLLRLLDNISTPEFRNVLFNIVWEDVDDEF